MCTPHRYHIVPHNDMRCLSSAWEQLETPHTNIGVGPPAQGDCNESPAPQRDPKVMGKVRLNTKVLIRRNLVYPHMSAPARNRTRNRNYISPTGPNLEVHIHNLALGD